MGDRRDTLDPITLLTGVLAFALLWTMMMRGWRLRQLDELERARKARAHLELELERKGEQLDGALEHITKLTNGSDEPAAGD